MPFNILLSKFLLVLLPTFSAPAGHDHVFPKTSHTRYALASPQAQARPSLVGAISVTWSPVANATGYVLEKSSSGASGTFTVLKSFSASEHSYRHAGLYYNQKVYYRIKAVGSGEESAYSSVVSATTFKEGHEFKIMPLGDSNTEGGNSTVPLDEKVAYRDKLEELLNNSIGGGQYDFVGSESTGQKYLEDTNHAGFGGARDEDIAELLKYGEFDFYENKNDMRGPGGGPYLDKYNPDIILLHIGTNWVDGSAGAVNDVKNILDQIDLYEDRANKEVTVILAKIILTAGQDPKLDTDAKAYSNNVRAMAEKRVQQDGDRILFVDMQDGAGLIYKTAPANSGPSEGDFSDNLHPNIKGYNKMAQVWFKALEPLLDVHPEAPDTQAPETTIATKPAAVTNKTSASFSFSSTESGVIFQVSLDGAAFKNAATPFNISGLADGEHTLRVRAVDAAGNTDETPASYTWAVDTKAPAAPSIIAVSEDKGPNTTDGITADNKLIIKGTAEANAVVTVFEGETEIGKATAANTGAWAFSYESSALPQGAYTFTASATDAAGNKGPLSAGFAVQIDLTAPTAKLTTSSSATVNQAFSIALEFSEDVYGVAAADFLVSNGSLSNFSASGKTRYTALITPTTDGEVTVQYAAGKATDLAGNANGASNTIKVKYDATEPTVILSADAPAVVKEPFTVTFNFSEAVTGFEVADISVTNGTAGNFTKTGATTYTASISPAADGEVSVRVPAGKAVDTASNANKASAVFKWLYDVQRPTVVLSTNAKNPANAAFTVQLSFSEQVTNLSGNDVTVSNGTASQLNKVDAQTYTVLITPAANGEVKLEMAANKAQDLAGNGNETSNELVLVYDASRPAVTISSEAPARIKDAFTVSFSFSEDIEGFELADISLVNATAGDLNIVSNRLYTAQIRPAQDGTVAISVAANKVQDAATNGNTASNKLERTYDTTAPAGYAISFSVDKVDAENQTNVSLKVIGAEVGATYSYSIKSNKGDSEVKGTAKVSSAAFTIPNLNLTSLADGQLTVSLRLVDELGNEGAAVTDQVQKLTKNVTAVSAVQSINVPFRTEFEDVPLPAKVEVTFSNGNVENLDVKWGAGNYNGLVPATYALTGELQLNENASNTNNLKAQATVTVEPNKAPTALRLSTETFKPDVQPGDLIGTLATTDPDDDEFSYTLVGGQGDEHNQLFEISNNELLLKTTNGLTGVSAFTIRVRSVDPFQNSIEKAFTLTKTPYHPQEKLKFVNAFSPDGDGRNDTWLVPELKYYNEVEVEVFDRSGARLFHSINPDEGWDGSDKGGRVQSGSYFYIIQIKDIGLVQKGVVTILK